MLYNAANNLFTEYDQLPISCNSALWRRERPPYHVANILFINKKGENAKNKYTILYTI